MIDLERSVEVPDSVLVRVINGEAVLLNLDDEFYYGLDNVSTEFWQSIVDQPALQAAVDSLVGVFDVGDNQLRADFNDFVGELLTNGLLRYADETADA